MEVFFQRANEYSLAGSIHKGRVTRVLPGMQSAFVDLGLERDTFLYVSDFFEEDEEFDRVTVTREEARPGGGDRGNVSDRAARLARRVSVAQQQRTGVEAAAETAETSRSRMWLLQRPHQRRRRRPDGW